MLMNFMLVSTAVFVSSSSNVTAEALSRKNEFGDNSFRAAYISFMSLVRKHQAPIRSLVPFSEMSMRWFGY